MLILFSTVENIIFSIVILLTSIALIALLYWLIKKEHTRYKNDKYLSVSDVTTFDDLLDLVSYRFTKHNQVYFSLLYLSIDQFDQITEYIHPDGVYQYLQKVGHSIRMNLFRGAKFAQSPERETFLIYLPELLDEDKLIQICLKFKQASEKKMVISNDLSIQRKITIGAVNYPQHGSGLNELLLNLKSALYYGKRMGGNTISIYNDSMKQTEDTLKHYKEMKDALKNKEVQIKFEPLMESEDSKCYGMYTLISQQKGKELISYREIMPLLETTDDAFWFGQWVFEKSLEHSFDVYNTMKNKEYYTFIPVSVSQLEQTDIANYMDVVTKKYQIDPRKVVLHVLVARPASSEIKLVKNIINLKNLGFKFSIDYQKDLSILKQFISNFKIDFLRINAEVLEKEYDNIFKQVKDQVTLVATHVDKETQIRLMATKEVPFVEGSYFGTPLTKEELLPFVTKNRL